MIENLISKYYISKGTKEKILEIVCVIMFFLYATASISLIINNNIFNLIILLWMITVFLIRKMKIDLFFIIIILFWVIINILSVFINQLSDFVITHFLATTVRLIIPYFFIKLIGDKIFDHFFKYAYVLILLSLILFFIQSIKISLFYDVGRYLNFLTNDEQKAAGGWNIIFYSFSAWASDRNCGFMWEPGAYAFMLIFLLCYNLMRTNLKLFSKKNVVIIIAIITTFSTAGYLALFSLIIFYIISKPKKSAIYKLMIPFLIMGLLFVFYRIYNNTDFLKDKIDSYVDRGIQSSEWKYKENKKLRVTRLGIAIIELEGSLHNPLGNGILHNDFILKQYGPVDGSNSLAVILHKWGWIGLLFVLYAFYKFTYNKTGVKFFSIIFMLCMSIVCFSNPMVLEYFIYTLVYYPFIFIKKKFIPINNKIE